MSSVHLSCPHCAGILQVDTQLAGRQVTCPTCHGVVTIPDFGPEMGGAVAPPAPTQSPNPAQDLVQLACPHCTGAFQVLTAMAGQQVGCPHCQNAITVPAFSPPGGYPPPPSPAPPPVLPSAPAPFPAPASATGPASAMGPASTPTPAPGMRPAGSAAGGGAGRPIPVTPKPVDGGVVRPVEAKPKTVGRGTEKVELRKLTPEEKAQRRRTRNIVMSVSFIVVLFIVFAVLLSME